MDEAIATVVTVTGTTPERAAQYVQLADGDPNQAVQLFFESDGADLAGASSPQPPPAATSGHTGTSDHPIDLDDDDEHISDDNDPEITGFRRQAHRHPPPRPAAADAEDDEAMARRLQEEMYGEGGIEHAVRAPIARQTETLVGPGADPLPLGGAGMDAAIEARMQELTRRRRNQCLYADAPL
jgi:hypothetical protein